MTQEELAEKLFVPRQAVSNWETGKNQPDIDTLQTMAEVLGGGYQGAFLQTGFGGREKRGNFDSKLFSGL